jgi:hypothetical protein
MLSSRRFAGGCRSEDIEAAIKAGEQEELLLIIKGDMSGSVEALEDALSRSTLATRWASGCCTVALAPSTRTTSTWP